MVDLFNLAASWAVANPILTWLMTYVFIMVGTWIVGISIVGSWRFGLVIGLSFVNGVSITFATLATQTQPFWIAVVIFAFSVTLCMFSLPKQSAVEQE